MRRSVVAPACFALLVSLAGPSSARGREGCQAFNPIEPMCSYKVTHTSGTPITGVAGFGTWVVRIERDGKTLTYRSLPDGRPTIYEIAFKVGDVVKARALAPGSGLTVGHDD